MTNVIAESALRQRIADMIMAWASGKEVVVGYAGGIFEKFTFAKKEAE